VLLDKNQKYSCLWLPFAYSDVKKLSEHKRYSPHSIIREIKKYTEDEVLGKPVLTPIPEGDL